MMLDPLMAGGDAIVSVQSVSAVRVQQALELSLAPAFLLVGIGSIMNVMMVRLNWVAGRLERLELPEGGESSAAHASEVEWLGKRRRISQLAIKFSTGAAATISVIIAVLFVSAFIRLDTGIFVMILWVMTIGLLITGLGHFLRETLLAADGPQS